MGRLIAYKGLLTTFGKMNLSDNFRDRFTDSPLVAQRIIEPWKSSDPETQQSNSENRSIDREGQARQLVGESAMIWRSYLEMGGRYFNAQLGKLDESRNACTQIYELERHNIKPDKLAETDAIIYHPPANGIQEAA